MALAGRFICSVTGIDSMGGFHPSLDAILEGLGYAAPPIMVLLFILDVRFGLLPNSFRKPLPFFALVLVFVLCSYVSSCILSNHSVCILPTLSEI